MLHFFLILFIFDLTTKVIRAALHLENPVVIFSVLIATSLLIVVKNNFSISRSVLKTNLFAFFVLFLAIGLIWLSVGVLNGNNLRHAINDSAAFLIYSSSGFVLAQYFFGGAPKNKKSALRKLLFSAALIASVEMVICLVWMTSADPEQHFLVLLMDNPHINNLGDYTQAFSINMLVFVPLFFLLIGLSIQTRSLQRRLVIYLAQGVVLIAITLSYVRVFWVAMFLGIIGYLVLLKKWGVLLMLISIASLVLIWGMRNDGLGSSNFVNRLTSVQEIGESSNAMKLLQVKFLVDSILEDPLMGKGFGLHLTSLVRDDKAPYSYEVDLVALTAKIGLIGMSIIGLMLIRLCWHFANVFNFFVRHQFHFEAFATFLGLFYVGYIFLVDLTNPYLGAPLGIFFFFFSIAILDLIDRIQIDLRSSGLR